MRISRVLSRYYRPRWLCPILGHRWWTVPGGANFRYCMRCGTEGWVV